jgi:tetratricopeptide (TPR) repeat protein
MTRSVTAGHPVLEDFAYPADAPSRSTNATAEAAYSNGLQLARSDQLPEAHAAFASAVAAAPDHAAALHMMGLCCWLAGNTRDGIKYLARSIQGTNTPPQTYLALSAICVQRGGIPEAAGWFKKALRQMDRANGATWAEKAYFKGVRDSAPFRGVLDGSAMMGASPPSPAQCSATGQ